MLADSIPSSKTNIFQSKLIYCHHFRTCSRCAMFDWSDTVFRRRNLTRRRISVVKDYFMLYLAIFHSSQLRLILYLHQRPIFFKANSIHSSIVAILELIRGAQCLIEVIRSSGEEMWRVDAYQIPYYSRGIEEAKRTHLRFADCSWNSGTTSCYEC
jgi:uncharacterized membrane protein